MNRIVLLILSFLVSVGGYSQRIQRSDKGLYGLAVTKSNGNIKWLSKPKYSSIENNYDGSFSVCDESGKWGIITKAGKEVIECNYPSKNLAEEAFQFYLDPSKKQYASNIGKEGYRYSNLDFTLTRDYSTYIKQYVEQKINSWQKKGEFEKSSDYQKRVTESTRKEKIMLFTREVCEECLKNVKDKELRMQLGEYDADNETFLIKTEIGDFVLPVSINNAPRFKASWSKVVADNTYDIVNGRIILRSSQFSLEGKNVASYSDTNHALYAQANVQYNFDPIDIPLQDEVIVKQPQITKNNIQIGKSDVDINIPISKATNDKTFALIFANEHYRDEATVKYALNDGQSVSKYFTQTLGIPSSNIHLVQDATKNDIVRELDWLKKVSSVYNDINIMVYYAGHGCPDEVNGTAFLIPIDGSGNNPKTLYSLAELYKELGEINSNRTLIFMDACFSGTKRGSGMLAYARGIALKSKQEPPKNNMIVLSAAQGDETAWPYEEKSHGLFTYFLLKKLQETNGNTSLGQLSDYIIDQVGKHSIIKNSKKQTPTVSIAPQFRDDWYQQKLR